MNEWKSAFASKTVWAGIFAALAGFLGVINLAFGTEFYLSAEDQATLASGAVLIVGLVTSLVSAISGVLAVIGRVTAKKRLGLGG